MAHLGKPAPRTSELLTGILAGHASGGRHARILSLSLSRLITSLQLDQALLLEALTEANKEAPFGRIQRDELFSIFEQAGMPNRTMLDGL